MKARKCIFIVLLALLWVQCNRKAHPVENRPEIKPANQRNSNNKTAVKTENFDNFYQRFHSDSVFQISRVQFPLKGQKIEMEGTTSWKKEKWQMIKAWASEIDRKTYNVKTSKKEDSYFEGIYCKNCIFSFEMEYRLINGKWYLVYLMERDE